MKDTQQPLTKNILPKTIKMLYHKVVSYNNNNNVMLHNSFSSNEEWPLQLFVYY